MENKRRRRSEDELLTDAIVQLYQRIGERVTKLGSDRKALDEIFEALHPLRSLEDQYRGRE